MHGRALEKPPPATETNAPLIAPVEALDVTVIVTASGNGHGSARHSAAVPPHETEQSAMAPSLVNLDIVITMKCP